MTAQKKHLTGDSKQLPLGDLTKNEYRKCGLIATLKIRPEEPKVKAKTETTKTSKTKTKTKSKDSKKKDNSKEDKQKKKTAETAPKVDVDTATAPPPAKKGKKVKVPPDQIQEVLEGLQELKVSNIYVFVSKLMSIHVLFQGN